MKVTLQILPKIGCHGNVPKRIKKRGPDRENSHKYLSFAEMIVKIGPVDNLSQVKKRRNYRR